jgi:hypothetical protein
MPLSRRRQWFAEGDGEDPGTPAPAPAPTPSDPPETGEPGKSDPNADWVLDRVTRAKQSAITDLLKDLNVPDVDTLRGALSEYGKLRESQMSELEKAQTALASEQAARTQDGEKIEQLEQQIADMQTAQRTTTLNDGIKAAAQAARATVPADVVLWARKNVPADELAKLLDDDDKVNEDGVKALVEKAREARPHWFTGLTPGSPSNAGGRPPEPGKAQKEKARGEMRRSVRSRF